MNRTMPAAIISLFSFSPGLLDDRTPLRELLAEERRKLGRRRAYRLDQLRLDPLAHVGKLDRARKLGADLVDDDPRRACRSEYGIPRSRLVAGQSRLRHRRQIRQNRHPPG